MEKTIMELIKTIKETITSISKPIKNITLEITFEYQSSKLKAYLEQINSIKTLYQPERRVEVDKIYFPVNVKCQGEISKVVHSLDLLSYDNCILVEGTAGHGKSLLMRHIAVHEIKHGSRVPVFILLRKKDNNVKLTELICDELELLGFSKPDKALIYLLRNRKILIILDGFDEVKADSRRNLLSEIEYLARKYKKPNIIISSRPNLEVRLSHYFSVASLVDLNIKDQLKFIRHMTYGEKNSELINSFNNNKFISGVTKTPLLLILLIIAYRAESRIPENLTEFYRIIFSTLLYRHDDMKIGYNRERKSSLGNYELQSVFEALSYFTLASNKVRFNGDFFVKNIRKSTDLTCDSDIKNCDIENIKHDIVHITCLIVEDGFDTYSYIHKSIQEYFASLYITSLGEAVIEKFFNHVLKDFSNILEWSQVVKFISETQKGMYVRFFALQIIHIYFTKDLKKITVNGLKKIIGEDSFVMIDDDGEGVNVFFASSFLYYVSPEALGIVKSSIEKYIGTKSFEAVEYLNDCPLDKYESIHISTSENNIQIKDFFNEKNLWVEATRYINENDYHLIHQILLGFKEYLTQQTKRESSFLSIIEM